MIFRDGPSRHQVIHFQRCTNPCRYIDPTTGRRSSTAESYIYNQIDQNQNLVVLYEKRVVRVLFE